MLRTWLWFIPKVLRYILLTKQDQVQLRSLMEQLRAALRHDRDVFVQAIAQEAQTMSQGAVYQRLRPLLRFGGNRRKHHVAPAVRFKDGSLAEDATERLNAWIEHFSEMERGPRISPQDLLDHCRQFQQAQLCDFPEIGTGDIITRTGIEASFRGTAPGKSPGLDCIPGELLHFAPGPLARALMPLVLKMCTRLQEPVQWKGGQLFTAFKGKGDQTRCDSHRGLLVSSVLGKAVRAQFRKKLMNSFDAVSSPLQLGGKPGVSCLVGSHAVRLFQQFCRQDKCSYAIIFLDLKEAFYRVLRPAVVGRDLDTGLIQKIMRESGVPEEAIAELINALASRTVMQQAGTSKWLQAALGEMFSATWFQLSGQKDVVETSTGSRPGDSLADATFNLLFAHMLAALTLRL